MADAIVIPMFPGISRWKMNSLPLRIVLALIRPKLVIGRSVFATQLALKCGFREVIYDGRGAIAAEWKEYNVGKKKLVAEIAALEKECVLKSNYKIAVSQKLADYWKAEFNYGKQDYEVIPCTLNSGFENAALTKEAVSAARKKLGFGTEDIIYAYAGSSAGWQSFELLKDFLKEQLKANDRNKVLFLSERNDAIAEIEKEFPGKVTCKKVSPAQVPAYLMAADFGLLIREKSITNLVASPVKFAEYLACGLKVIISEDLGDFSAFVKQHDCGEVYTQFHALEKVSFTDKLRIRSLALQHFSKKAYSKQYKTVLKW